MTDKETCFRRRTAWTDIRHSNLYAFITKNMYTLYTVDATKFVTAQIDATFHEGREEWGTVISILQVLILGCLGRDFVGKQSKDAFSFCHK